MGCNTRCTPKLTTSTDRKAAVSTCLSASSVALGGYQIKECHQRFNEKNKEEWGIDLNKSGLY